MKVSRQQVNVAAALVMVAFGPYLLAVSSCGILGAFLSNPNHVRILLSHRPERVSTYEQFGFDLILTGHAHGGQWLMPFVGRGGYSPDQHFFPKYVDGRYALANGSEMIVSRGLARESTPLPRLFNPPEIMVVELMGSGKAKF